MYPWIYGSLFDSVRSDCRQSRSYVMGLVARKCVKCWLFFAMARQFHWRMLHVFAKASDMLGCKTVKIIINNINCVMFIVSVCLRCSVCVTGKLRAISRAFAHLGRHRPTQLVYGNFH